MSTKNEKASGHNAQEPENKKRLGNIKKTVAATLGACLLFTQGMTVYAFADQKGLLDALKEKEYRQELIDEIYEEVEDSSFHLSSAIAFTDGEDFDMTSIEEARELKEIAKQEEIEKKKKLKEERKKKEEAERKQAQEAKAREEAKKLEHKSKVDNKQDSSQADSSGFVYYSHIPMPKEHQKYLYDQTQKHGLDYKKALALVKHESNFNPNAISPTNDYGYFQINIVNHDHLSKTVGGSNPLDPYVSIDWGTYMLSDLYEHWSSKGISGRALDEYVWSSYNKGLGGFQKYGKATSYIQGVDKEYNTLFN